ncbi:hypothetical protein Pint_09572 [Pistacia integerrima]|uniref:Uncharacterized protein n=1 Tax=Pistacia integerrima TaxID=434235 RepID=A0ACC0XKL6_9ROSI|nr:hypothetical protein Pint_09572 [Pistacia integerrima]
MPSLDEQYAMDLRKSVMNYYFTVDSHHHLLRFLKTTSYWKLPRKDSAGMSLRVEGCSSGVRGRKLSS